MPVKKGGSITKEINGKEVILHRAYTPARWTFIIDKDGTIISVDTEVKVSEDSQNVLNFIKGW